MFVGSGEWSGKGVGGEGAQVPRGTQFQCLSKVNSTTNTSRGKVEGRVVCQP